MDRVPVVNGLRGIAILGVLFHHIVSTTVPPAGPYLSVLGVRVTLSPLITNGWTGVNLFFILSGFVLFLPYARGERPMDGWGDGLAFYRRRFRRLMPLYYFAVLIVSVLSATHGVTAASLTGLVSVLSLTFGLGPHTFGPRWNPALWSVGVEILFSALFPLIIMRARGRGMARWAVAILPVALLMRVVGYLVYPDPGGASYHHDNVICRLDEFVLGMWLAELYVGGRLPRRPGLFGTAGLLLVAAAWIGFDLTLHGTVPSVARAALNDLLDAGLCAILVAALSPGSRLEAALSRAPLQVVGMMCYSLYIWHMPVLEAVAPDRGVMSWGPFAAAVALFLSTTFAIAALSYRFIEFRAVADWKSLFLLGARPLTADSRAGATRDNRAAAGRPR